MPASIRLLASVAAIACVSAWGQSEEPIVCASSICIEADTGLILNEFNADEQRPPASMVKLIEMLMVVEGREAGSWTMETAVPVSQLAQSMGGTQVFLKAGEEFPLNNMINAIAVASANDAAMAVAEGLWGSESAYLLAANQRAQALGMTNTVIRSAHGLPPSKGEDPDLTTARDMATLARYCTQNETLMKLAAQRSVQFRETDAVKSNTNHLVGVMEGCDGLKTGYTRAAGWCVTATAKRGDIRLIAVVMGCESNKKRFEAARRLLEEGFASLSRQHVLHAGDLLDKSWPVLNSPTESVQLQVTSDVWMLAKRDDPNQLDFILDVPNELRAPIQRGTVVGEVRVVRGQDTIGQAPVAVSKDLLEAGWKWKLKKSLLKRRSAEAASEYGG